MQKPTISIVTVCLNQRASIEKAILSVLDQADDCIEYIVIDGGSSDGTVDVIRRYAHRLAYWVSEPDRGQSHALNKGFAHASGDVVGWLNADDLLTAGALARVREIFSRERCDVLCGACRYEYADGGRQVLGVTDRDLQQLEVYDPVHQPSCFWRRELHERVGGLSESLHYGMDWDLWLRMWRAGARFHSIDDVLSVYQVTGVNKTSTGGERRNREMYEIVRQYAQGPSLYLAELSYRLLWPLKRLRRREPQWLCTTMSNLARTAFLVALGPMFGFDRVRRCTHPFS
jgi:GT2 family glycosyltransferase